jgi:PAS domain S-box-containing protein
LLDYRLPDFEGVEFLTALKNQQPEGYPPVIVATGQGSEAIAVEVLKAGAEDYLIKGQLSPYKLRVAIDNVIEKAQLQQQLRQQENKRRQQLERERLVAQLTQQIHQSLDLQEILYATVQQVRQLLQTDRVLVFRLESDLESGQVVVESVGTPWTPLLSSSFHDPCFKRTHAEPYQQGRVAIVADVNVAGLEPCYLELMAQLQVQAVVVVPILQEDNLWGLLIAHHCSEPRQWQSEEIDWLKQLATQLGIALQQAELYQQAQIELAERRRAEAALRRANEQFTLAAAAINSLIYDYDLQRQTVERTQGLTELVGYSLAEAEPTVQWWRSLIHPEDAKKFDFDRVWATLPQGADRFCYEYRVRHKDGHYCWVQDSGIIIRNRAGQPIRMVGKYD